MMRFRQGLSMTMLALAFTAGAQPAAAGQAECWDKVINWCADAMEDAKWYERFALGVTCSAMIVGCAGDIT